MISNSHRFISWFLVLSVLFLGGLKSQAWNQPLKGGLSTRQIDAIVFMNKLGALETTAIGSSIFLVNGGYLPAVLAFMGGAALVSKGGELLENKLNAHNAAARKFTYLTYCQQTQTDPAIYTSILRDGNGNNFAIDLQKDTINGVDVIKYRKTEIRKKSSSQRKFDGGGGHKSSPVLYFGEIYDVYDENRNPIPKEKIEEDWDANELVYFSEALEREYGRCTDREDVKRKNRQIKIERERSAFNRPVSSSAEIEGNSTDTGGM